MLKIHRPNVAAESAPLNKLRELIQSKSSSLLNPDQSIVGCESMSSAAFTNIASTHDTMASLIRSELIGVGNEASEAMAQALMVCSDETKLREAMTVHLGTSVGNESFAKDSVVNNLHLTVGVAGELAVSVSDASFIFPPVLVDQKTTNYRIDAIRTVIEPKFYHAKDGSVTDWGKLNLSDANVKSGMLRKELNVFVPEIRDGNEADFISEDYITPWEVKRSDGKVITTSYLGKGDSDINLISTSTTKGMDRNTENTILDRIDEGAKIRGIIIGVGDAASPKAAYLNTLSVNRSTFTKSATESDGNGRDVAFAGATMMLNLVDYVHPEFGGFPEIADIPEFKALKDAGYTKIGFKVSNGYSLDLSNGTFSTTSSSPQVSYLEKAGAVGVNALADAKASNGALITAIKGIFLGTDFYGTLSNATLKLDGDKIGTQPLHKLYPLNVRTPVEVATDVLSDLDDNDAIKAMSQALMFRRDDETVDELHKWFEWAVSNLGHEGVSDTARKDLDIIGLHYLLKPYVKRVPIKLQDLLKEEDTTSKLNVLETGLVTKIQDELVQMFRETNYRSVTRTHGSDPKHVPEVGLFLDSRVGNYIMRTGEDRTLGDGVTMAEKPVIHVSDRDSMKDVIYAMPRAKSYGGEKDRVFGFGHSIEITPVVVKRARDNGIAYDQVQVFPIYTNIVTMPMLLRFDIEGLTEYFAKASHDVVVNG